MGFPGGSVVKNLPANAGDMGLIPGSRISPGEENGNSLQYSCLENPVDRGAWWVTVHGVAKESDMTEGLNNQRGPTRLCSSSIHAGHFQKSTKEKVHGPVVIIGRCVLKLSVCVSLLFFGIHSSFFQSQLGYSKQTFIFFLPLDK